VQVTQKQHLGMSGVVVYIAWVPFRHLTVSELAKIITQSTDSNWKNSPNGPSFLDPQTHNVKDATVLLISLSSVPMPLVKILFECNSRHHHFFLH